MIEVTEEDNVSWVNASGETADFVRPTINRVAREIANWVKSTRGSAAPSLLNRAAYAAPDNPYSQMRTARTAVDNDDIVGGVCDITEGLKLQGMKWEGTSADDADVFNQISKDLNLDAFARMWHREEFRYSQVVVGVWWGRKTYTVRGRSVVEGDPEVDPATGVAKTVKKPGPKRKKKYEIATPVALTFLDPLSVVPLKPGPFGQDRLAWHASKEEFALMSATALGAPLDEVMAEFMTGPITVGRGEASYLQSLGIDPRRLIGLNPSSVFRCSKNRISYERFAALRLKSVFPLLDLKQQLMEADRVALVGAANYILLIKQGSKEEPALPEEIANLKANFKVIAKLPVVIGDHRLNIEIITPDQSFTLDAKKYDTLDRRILNRTLGALALGSSSSEGQAAPALIRGVARQLENERHMMKRALEREVARRIVDHPFNAAKFEGEPNLAFTPRNVQLDSGSAEIQAIMALRTQKELSRESTLEFFGFDQVTEALRRQFEEESGLDDIFQTQVPFNGSGAEGNGEGPNGGGRASQVSGATGGRPKGGGTSRQSPKSSTQPRTASGNKSTGGN